MSLARGHKRKKVKVSGTVCDTALNHGIFKALVGSENDCITDA